MRGLRVVLILAILIVLVAVVVVVVLPSLNQQPAPAQPAPEGEQVQVQPEGTPLPTNTPIPLAEIVIAVQELPRGFRIPPEGAVAVRQWPVSAVPFNAVTDPNDVIGKIARTDIYREQPILTNMLVDDFSGLARVGSDAAALMPSGFVGVSLPVDRITSVAYAVQPGDRVDMIVSLLFVEVDEEFQSLSPNQLNFFYIDEETGQIVIGNALRGRPDTTTLGPVIVAPSEQQRPRLLTQRTIQNALVIYTGNFPPNGRIVGIPPTPTPVPVEQEETEEGTPPPPTPTPPYPDIITLAVTPQDAVILTWFIESRTPVTLALRSVNDTSLVPTDDVTLDYIMNEFAIDLPAKRSYTIEPAIRSIRQLVAGDQISLRQEAGTTP